MSVSILIPKNTLTTKSNGSPNRDTIHAVVDAFLDDPDFIAQWNKQKTKAANVIYVGSFDLFLEKQDEVRKTLLSMMSDRYCPKIEIYHALHNLCPFLSNVQIKRWVSDNVGELFQSKPGKRGGLKFL